VRVVEKGHIYELEHLDEDGVQRLVFVNCDWNLESDYEENGARVQAWY